MDASPNPDFLPEVNKGAEVAGEPHGADESGEPDDLGDLGDLGTEAHGRPVERCALEADSLDVAPWLLNKVLVRDGRAGRIGRASCRERVFSSV